MRALYGALMCKQVNNNHLDNLHLCLGQLTSTSHDFNFLPGPNQHKIKTKEEICRLFNVHPLQFTSSSVLISKLGHFLRKFTACPN